MAIWIEHAKDSYIPAWLKSNLSDKCMYCGSPMLNYYNDDFRCTNRKCSNEHCYGFVAAKADFSRKLLGIKGVGFAGCLNDAKTIKATSPFQLLKYWGITPKVTVDTFLRMHCFEGVDSEWERIVKQLGVYTLDELFEKYDGKWSNLLEIHKDEIYENAKYVRFVERPTNMVASGPAVTLNIMITGTPNGFQTKEHFIEALNVACKGRILILHQKTKRQSGVDFLIREPGSTTRGKVEAAEKGGIPIVTSEEFMACLVAILNKLNAEGK